MGKSTTQRLTGFSYWSITVSNICS